MSGISTIEWLHGWQLPDGRVRTPRVWNPGRGCKPVSAGCKNCYAEAAAGSGFTGLCKSGAPYDGLVRLDGKRPHWTGEVAFDREVLAEPLGWRAPSVVFVDSMSDLFYEKFTDEQIAAVFGVMAATPRHVYIILTKRHDRMDQWFTEVAARSGPSAPPTDLCLHSASRILGEAFDRPLERSYAARIAWKWPLPNVILGVSVEDQPNAEARIPALLATPAACRLVSYEPALGPVDFRPWLLWDARKPGVDWLIVGGESGAGARPCAESWLEDAIRPARSLGAAVYVKQLGTVLARARGLGRTDRAGRRWESLPPALQVRQLPPVGAG